MVNILREIEQEVGHPSPEVFFSNLKRIKDDKIINMNDICKVKIRTTAAIMMDEYSRNRKTGSFILIDSATNETVAGGMLL